MKNGTWRASPLAVVSALVIAAAAILGFFLAKHSVESQNQALLKEDATQAAGVRLLADFDAQLDPRRPRPRGHVEQRLTARLRCPGQTTGGRPLHARLGPEERSHVRRHRRGGNGIQDRSRSSTPSYRPRSTRRGRTSCPDPVSYDGKTSTFGLALGPPLVPAGFAIYEQVSLDPFVATTATQAAPFHVLEAAVYATRASTTNQLVLANTRALPLTGATFETPVPVGSGSWWLVAEAKSPLAGRFPNAAPYVVLVFVLLLALAVGSVIEVVVRRQRYASCPRRPAHRRAPGIARGARAQRTVVGGGPDDHGGRPRTAQSSGRGHERPLHAAPIARRSCGSRAASCRGRAPDGAGRQPRSGPDRLHARTGPGARAHGLARRARATSSR